MEQHGPVPPKGTVALALKRQNRRAYAARRRFHDGQLLLASTMKPWIPVQAFGRLVQVGRLGGRVHMRLLFDSDIFQFTRSTANISFTGYEWTQRRWLPSPKANNKSSAARPLAQQRAQNSSALILPAIIGKSTMPVMMLSTIVVTTATAVRWLPLLLLTRDNGSCSVHR